MKQLSFRILYKEYPPSEEIKNMFFSYLEFVAKPMRGYTYEERKKKVGKLLRLSVWAEMPFPDSVRNKIKRYYFDEKEIQQILSAEREHFMSAIKKHCRERGIPVNEFLKRVKENPEPDFPLKPRRRTRRILMPPRRR